MTRQRAMEAPYTFHRMDDQYIMWNEYGKKWWRIIRLQKAIVKVSDNGKRQIDYRTVGWRTSGITFKTLADAKSAIITNVVEKMIEAELQKDNWHVFIEIDSISIEMIKSHDFVRVWDYTGHDVSQCDDIHIEIEPQVFDTLAEAKNVMTVLLVNHLLDQ